MSEFAFVRFLSNGLLTEEERKDKNEIIQLHEYLAKYPTPEEAAKHASEAQVMMRHFEEAVKKIKTQRERKPGEARALTF